MQLYWQAYNGDTTQTIYQGDALCEADQCMAWRWCDTAVKNEGYCGLAGKEGAE